MKRLTTLALTGTLAAGGAGFAAVPASAAHRARTGHNNACHLRDVSYRASGTLVAWNVTQNSDGSWSGTVSVAVRKGDHHARAQVGTTTTYTLTDARVGFGPHASNPPATGSRIQLLGRALALGKRCSGSGTAVTESYAIERVHVHAPAAASS